VLCRSFFFQSVTNYERMQNVGFAYCMAPALTRLYHGEALEAAMARHLTFFNSHPYMAGALLGATVRLEEEVAAERLPVDRVVAFKKYMMGPMAAIGDSFFWASLRPLAAVWAIMGVLSGVYWAPVAFLLLYNAFHLGLRTYGVFVGYRTGERICERINRFELVKFADRSHYLTGAFLGVTAALYADWSTRTSAAVGEGAEPFLLSALILIFFFCLKRKMPMPMLLYTFSIGCIGLITALDAWFPLI
jgi:PTS system mannose-specific IID component